jgi:hypothetical protein
MVTLQQYSGALGKQTEDEASSNEPIEPEELPTAVEVEEEPEEELESPDHDELMKRSASYRKSQKFRGKKSES